LTAATVAQSVGRSTVALVQALRPRQWTKNLLVYAGVIFAGTASDGDRWRDATVVFVAFSLISSASYLFNDVRDAAADRTHPLKRHRPVARGALSPQLALGTAALLALAGMAAAALLGLDSLQYALAFAALQFAYTVVLKRVAIVDVLTIAALFVVRAAVGADAVDVHISVWLLLCTALLATFLGLAKRRAELVLAAQGETPGRAALRSYSLPALDAVVLATGAATVASYAAYAIEYAPHARWMAITVPFVAFGVARYVYLVRRQDLGEEPENVLLTDRVLLATVALWVLVAALVVAYR
jgi:decaprenyl-phosphate phosphoribosyltransferase